MEAIAVIVLSYVALFVCGNTLDRMARERYRFSIGSLLLILTFYGFRNSRWDELRRFARRA